MNWVAWSLRSRVSVEKNDRDVGSAEGNDGPIARFPEQNEGVRWVSGSGGETIWWKRQFNDVVRQKVWLGKCWAGASMGRLGYVECKLCKVNGFEGFAEFTFTRK